MGKNWDNLLAGSAWGRGQLAGRTARDIHAMRQLAERQYQPPIPSAVWDGNWWVSSDGLWWWDGKAWQPRQR